MHLLKLTQRIVRLFRYSHLLESNKSNSSMIETNPRQLCTNSAESPNSSNALMERYDFDIFNSR